MDGSEKRVLHGLYFRRQIVGEKLLYSSGEVLWLTKQPLPNGAKWADANGKLQSLDVAADDYLASIGATNAAAERPLAYLQQTGYISYEKNANFFRVSVTARGADLARELHTSIGRLNVLYRERKEGVIWLSATLLVSFIAFVITSYIKK